MSIPFDPSTLGTDLNIALSDYGEVWGLASGLLNLANALVRRLHCDPGGLFYDTDYGYNMLNLLNATLTPAQQQKEQQAAGAEVAKDERVRSCQATFNFDRPAETLFATFDCTLVNGQPFVLVLAATNVTVSILSINGAPLAQATPAAPNIQLVVGPAGKDGAAGIQGGQGIPGAAGTPQVFLDGDEDTGSSQSGNEDVVYQRWVNLGDLPGTFTAEIGGLVYSTAGTGIFQLRLGGTKDTADGAVVGTFSTGSATPVPVDVTTAGVTNPGGWQYVKITAKSSAPGETAGILERTVSLR